MVGNVLGFPHNSDSYLEAVSFEEVIEVIETLPLLVSGRCQETITGITVEDTGFVFFGHGGETVWYIRLAVGL